MSDQPSRRTVLGIASSAIATGLAGCVTGSDQQERNSERDEDADGHSEEDAHTDSHEADAHSHGNHDEELEGPSVDAEVTMTTTESGEHFDPHIVWVETGGEVVWSNESGSHSTTAYHSENDDPHLVPDDGGAWDSGTLSEPGAAFDHTFETEGVYHYYCAPHEESGMIGSVIVGRPDPDEQPALEEPPSEKPDAVREKLAGLNERIRSALDHDHDHDHDH